MPAPRIKSDWVEVGSRLKDAREYLGLHQDFVATQTGMTRTAVSLVEAGRREVSAIEMDRFARLYRRPVQWLTTGTYPEDIKVVIPPRLVEQMERLTQNDRDQVLRFAEFLAHAGKPPRVSSK